MKTMIRTLMIAGAAALALTATPARADDGEWRGHRERDHWSESRAERGHWREPREADRDEREIDREWQGLAESRERFYASWQGNPWRRARFERWYCSRRDELLRWKSHERQEEREHDRRWQR